MMDSSNKSDEKQPLNPAPENNVEPSRQQRAADERKFMKTLELQQLVRTDVVPAVAALQAYLLAGKPPAALTLSVISTITQLLANDQHGTVTMCLPGQIEITRHPRAFPSALAKSA